MKFEKRRNLSGIGLVPKKPMLDGYKNAMNSYGGDINIWKAMLNTYSYVIPKVIFTLGYGELSFALCLNSPLIVNADIQ
jgi:hypothetical protein